MRDWKDRSLIGAALIAVGLVIAVGVVAVAPDDVPDARAAATPQPSVASSAVPADLLAPALLADVSLVDIRTGRVTNLPSSIRSISGVAHIQASPDGSALAFDDGEAIYVADVDGSHVQRLTPESNAVTPAWSPDGSRIVFEVYDERIAIVDVATARVTLLTPDPVPFERVWLPSFSPDGRTILFTRSSGMGSLLGLWTVPATGGKATQLKGKAAYGSYSPDGTAIAYHWAGRAVAFDTWPWDFRITLVGPAGGHRRRLVRGAGCCMMAQFDWDWTRPAWSPDGTHVVYQSQSFGQAPGDLSVINVESGRETRIGVGAWPSWLDNRTLIVADMVPRVPVDAFLVDVRTGRARPLPRRIRAPAVPTQFAVSPDGGRLAFAAGDDIYVSLIDGERLHVVARKGDLSAPSWSPDGRDLVFSDGARIFVLHLPSGKVSRITGALGQIWRPNFSPDGRTILFTRAANDALKPGPIDLWTVPATGGDSSLLLRLPGKRQNAAFGTYGPDGTIAYRRTNYDGVDRTEMTEDRVWLADADGSNRRGLRALTGGMSQIDPDALWPAWSPDGTKVAYELLYGLQVIVIDVRTGHITRLDKGIHPTWVDNHTLIIEGYQEERWP